MNIRAQNTELDRPALQPPGIATSVAVVLAALAVLLALISLAVTTGRPVPLPDTVRAFFGVIHETNLWTWYNCTLLSAAGVTFLLVGAANRRVGSGPVLSWLIAAAIMFALSIDDLASLHEKLEPLGVTMNAVVGGPFPYAWVIPGAIVGLVIVASLVPLVLNVKTAVRWMLLLGLVFLLGSALGTETWTANVHARDGTTRTAQYILLNHAEELGEAIGAVFFVWAGLHALNPVATADGFDLRGGNPARAE